MYKGQSYILLTLILILSVFSFSCKEDKDELYGDAPKSVLAFDSEFQTEYPFSLINAEKQSITLFKTDEKGTVKEFISFIGEEQTPVFASFDENGFLSGIGTENATLTFANYNGNKVDIALIVDDETYIFKEFESDESWDELDHGLSFEYLFNEGRSSKKDLDEIWSYIASQYKNLGEMLVDASGNVIPGKNIAVKYLLNIIKDSTLFLVDHDKNIDYAILLTEIAHWGVKGAGPWGLFFTLITNYDTYVDWVEDQAYNAMVLYDKYFNEYNNGIGALKSGFGMLKATLSWTFYADIDLHAIEPSGQHIYWSSPYSSISGGYLDVDNREGGPRATENIYWKNPQDGIYEIYVDYYGASTLNGDYGTGNCLVNVYYNGIGKHYNIPLDILDTKAVTSVQLPTGTFSRDSQSPQVKIIINNCKRNQKAKN